MKTEIKILKKLIENKEKEYSIRELSKEIKSDYRITHKATQSLIQLQRVQARTIGKSTILTLNKKFSKEIFLAETERKEKAMENKNINTLLNIIKSNINTTQYILLLFGSFAKTKQNKKSDIDLLFISDNIEEEDLTNLLETIPFDIDYHLFAEKEWSDMLDSKKENLVKEIVRNNVILYNIEAYYELIKND
ncbi:MAG: nucleotidyltransferase domain-containing protein [Nanoarchaeota archaeon]|jgi:predicted nucleotidyltransferase|nr:nucleotidyltransferase domain-containing protein [Nanoarchaeota archaeon]